MSARFFEQETKARLAHRRELSHFLDLLIQGYRHLNKIRLSYIFCNDDVLYDINLQFLQHDTYTDIITFDLSERSDELQAEIYISVDRVAENASKFNTTYERELHRVIFHGALHLCGLRDKKPAEQKAMRAAEEAALDAWFA